MIFGVEVKIQQIPGIGSKDLRVKDQATLTNADAEVPSEREWESDKEKKCEMHDCRLNDVVRLGCSFATNDIMSRFGVKTTIPIL